MSYNFDFFKKQYHDNNVVEIIKNDFHSRLYIVLSITIKQMVVNSQIHMFICVFFL